MFAEGFLMACTVGGSPEDVVATSVVVLAKPACENSVRPEISASIEAIQGTAPRTNAPLEGMLLALTALLL